MLTFYVKSFAVFNEVYITRKLAGGKTFSKRNGLQLTNHTQATIVKDNCSYRKLVAGNGKEFRACHLKTTITAKTNHPTLRAGKLCTHSSRQAKAHGTQATGSNPLASKLDTQMLCCPHLMLTNVSSDDVIFILDYRVQSFEEFWSCLVTKVFVHTRPPFDTFPPRI